MSLNPSLQPLKQFSTLDRRLFLKEVEFHLGKYLPTTCYSNEEVPVLNVTNNTTQLPLSLLNYTFVFFLFFPFYLSLLFPFSWSFPPPGIYIIRWKGVKNCISRYYSVNNKYIIQRKIKFRGEKKFFVCFSRFLAVFSLLFQSYSIFLRFR